MTIPSLDATGKVVVVTGGSKGLGRAMALGFAEAGADVVVASRKLEPCEEVAAEIRALGRQALAVRCHVGDWDECAALVDATVAEFGRIDVLVNNAGIAPVPPSLLEVTAELFDKTIAVNLKGPLRLTALAAEHMAAGGLDHQHQLQGVAAPHLVHRRLRRGQGRTERAHQGGGRRVRPAGHPGQRHRVRHLPHRQLPRLAADAGAAGADGRRTWPSAGSPPPRRSSAPRCSWPATPRRT